MVDTVNGTFLRPLLDGVSDKSPCGEDLEYDPEFIEIEKTAQGKPEQQIGTTVIPAQQADWREVENKSIDLFKRTKDLRIAVYLTQALVHNKGLVGLKDGLLLIKGLLDQYWDEVHPRLDPSEDNDPTLRINSIAALCDAETMLKGIREAVLADSNVFGRFTLRDIQYAGGKTPVPSRMEETVPEMTTINAAFMDTNVEDLQALESTLLLSIEAVADIDTFLLDKLGTEQAADFSTLTHILNEARQVIAEQLNHRGIEGVGGRGSVNEEAATTPSNADGSETAMAKVDVIGGAAATMPVSGEVNSREDVIRLLDMACDYYSRCEPSSPVPLLLQRAKRLVSKDFMGIMRDLAPAGLTQVEEIGGVPTDDVK